MATSHTEPLDVSGDFDAATQALLCRFLNDNWDTAGVRQQPLRGTGFGPVAVSALQTFLNSMVTRLQPTQQRRPVPVDGQVTPATIKMLRMFLNHHWDIAGFRSAKLLTKGSMHRGFESTHNRATVKALQHFLNNSYFAEHARRESSTSDTGIEDSVTDRQARQGTSGPGLGRTRRGSSGHAKTSSNSHSEPLSISGTKLAPHQSSVPSKQSASAVVSHNSDMRKSHSEAGSIAKHAHNRPLGIKATPISTTTDRGASTQPSPSLVVEGTQLPLRHSPLTRTEESACTGDGERESRSRKSSASSRMGDARATELHKGSAGAGRKGSTASQGLEIFRSTMGSASDEGVRAKQASLFAKPDNLDETVPSVADSAEAEELPNLTACTGVMHKLPMHNLVNVGTGKDRVFKLEAGVLEYFTTRTGKRKGSLTLTAACTLLEQISEHGDLVGFRLLVPDQGVLVVQRCTHQRTPKQNGAGGGHGHDVFQIAPSGGPLPVAYAAQYEGQDDDRVVRMFTAAIKNCIALLRDPPELEGLLRKLPMIGKMGTAHTRYFTLHGPILRYYTGSPMMRGSLLKGSLQLTASCTLVEQHTLARPGFVLEVPGHGTLKAQGDRSSVQNWVTALDRRLRRERIGRVDRSATSDGWELPPTLPHKPKGLAPDWASGDAQDQFEEEALGLSQSSDSDSSEVVFARSPSQKRPPPQRPISVQQRSPSPPTVAIAATSSVRTKAKAAAERRKRSVSGPPISKILVSDTKETTPTTESLEAQLAGDLRSVSPVAIHARRRKNSRSRSNSRPIARADVPGDDHHRRSPSTASVDTTGSLSSIEQTDEAELVEPEATRKKSKSTIPSSSSSTTARAAATATGPASSQHESSSSEKAPAEFHESLSTTKVSARPPRVPASATTAATDTPPLRPQLRTTHNRREPPPATFAPVDGRETGSAEEAVRLPVAASEGEFIEGASAMSMDAALESISTPERKKIPHDKSPRRSSASKEVVAAAKAAATHAHADGGIAIDFTAQVAAMMSQIKQGPTPEEWMAMQLAKDKKAAALSKKDSDGL